MDPDEALRVAREAAAAVIKYGNGASLSAHELAEAFQALDEWLTKGGFAPSDWRKAFTE